MQGVSDGDLLISGLQHFSFCRRQWALAYIEMQWDDNYLTVDGSLRHDRADDPEFTEKRGGLIVSRAIPVRSERYGIVGKCDVVEFRADPGGVPLAGRDGLWLPSPRVLTTPSRDSFFSAITIRPRKNSEISKKQKTTNHQTRITRRYDHERDN